MSYPSITAILKERNLNVETASEPQLEEALLEAFKRDLPLGYKRVEELVAKQRANNGRAMLDADSKTDEAKQFIRLLGADIPRRVLENHFGVKLGFYNCHKGVATNDDKKINMSAREQILCQDSAFIDC